MLEYFNTEERTLVLLNPYILKFMTSIYITHFPKLLLENSVNLANLFNLHLGMILYFQADSIVLKRLYKQIIKILNFVQSNLKEAVQAKALQHIMQNDLLHQMVSEIDFDYSEKKYTS